MMSLNGVLIYCHGDGIKTMDNSQRGALIESYAQIRDASIGWCDKICLYKNEKGVEDFFYVSGGRGCHLCYFGDYPDVSFL